MPHMLFVFVVVASSKFQYFFFLLWYYSTYSLAASIWYLVSLWSSYFHFKARHVFAFVCLVEWFWQVGLEKYSIFFCSHCLLPFVPYAISALYFMHQPFSSLPLHTTHFHMHFHVFWKIWRIEKIPNIFFRLRIKLHCLAAVGGWCSGAFANLLGNYTNLLWGSMEDASCSPYCAASQASFLVPGDSLCGTVLLVRFVRFWFWVHCTFPSLFLWFCLQLILWNSVLKFRQIQI